MVKITFFVFASIFILGFIVSEQAFAAERDPRIIILLDKDDYQMGDKIMVSGTIPDPIETRLFLFVYDPIDKKDMGWAEVYTTPDGSFTHTFEITDSYTRPGEYQITVGRFDVLSERTVTFTFSTPDSIGNIYENTIDSRTTLSLDKDDYQMGDKILVSGTINDVHWSVTTLISLNDPLVGRTFAMDEIFLKPDGSFTHTFQIDESFTRPDTYEIKVMILSLDIEESITFTFSTPRDGENKLDANTVKTICSWAQNEIHEYNFLPLIEKEIAQGNFPGVKGDTINLDHLNTEANPTALMAKSWCLGSLSYEQFSGVFQWLVTPNVVDTIEESNTTPTTESSQPRISSAAGRSALPETQSEETATTEKPVPAWIKNTAKWWADGVTTDEEFTNGIQVLMIDGIIIVPDEPSDTVPTTQTESDEIPDWVKQTAQWWSDGLISDGEFTRGIGHLVKTGVINTNTDAVPQIGGQSETTATDSSVTTDSGQVDRFSISLDRDEYELFDDVTVTITNDAANTDPNKMDTTSFEFCSSIWNFVNGICPAIKTIQETGPDTSTFKTSICAARLVDTSDKEINVKISKEDRYRKAIAKVNVDAPYYTTYEGLPPTNEPWLESRNNYEIKPFDSLRINTNMPQDTNDSSFGSVIIQGCEEEIEEELEGNYNGEQLQISGGFHARLPNGIEPGLVLVTKSDNNRLSLSDNFSSLRDDKELQILLTIFPIEIPNNSIDEKIVIIEENELLEIEYEERYWTLQISDVTPDVIRNAPQEISIGFFNQNMYDLEKDNLDYLISQYQNAWDTNPGGCAGAKINFAVSQGVQLHEIEINEENLEEAITFTESHSNTCFVQIDPNEIHDITRNYFVYVWSEKNPNVERVDLDKSDRFGWYYSDAKLVSDFTSVDNDKIVVFLQRNLDLMVSLPVNVSEEIDPIRNSYQFGGNQ